MENAAGGNLLRDGAGDPVLSGPLGATLLERLADPVTGIILNSWLNADGDSKGDAQTYLDQ